MDTKQPIAITITPGTIATALLILGGFWLAFMLRDLLLVVLTAIVFASAIEPITKVFTRFGIPKVLAVVIIYLVTMLMIISFFYFFLPPLINEALDFFKTLPSYFEKLNLTSIQAPLGEGDGGAFATQLLQMQDVLKTSSMSVLGAANTIFGGLMSFILIVVLSFYIAVQDKGLDGFLRLVTPLRHHGYLLGLWKRAQIKIGRWLQGQLLLSLLVGVMVYIGLLFFGVKYALLLAIVAAVLELIPVFGSILAAIPAVVVAFIDSGTTLALLIIVLYTIINQLQGNIIYPMVVQKVLGVPPIVIILAIIAGAQLAGFLGIFIAVPVSAAVMEWVGDVQRGKQQLIRSQEHVTPA